MLKSSLSSQTLPMRVFGCWWNMLAALLPAALPLLVVGRSSSSDSESSDSPSGWYSRAISRLWR